MDNQGKPIRVLHVLGKLNVGGAEMMVMNLYRNIDRSKVQFDFVTHTSEHCDFTDDVLKLGGRIYHCPRYAGKNHFQYCKWWSEFLENHREYQIIHGHVRSTATLYLFIAKKCGRITISHSHSTSNGKGVAAHIKDILQLPTRYIADYFFACSREAGEWLFGKKVCNAENFFVIKNAIDVEKFVFNPAVRDQYRSELGIEGKFVIGHVGRLYPPKNHAFLLKLISEIAEKNSNIILVLVGTGMLEDSIKNEIRRLQIDDKVMMLGNRNDIAQLMWAMDIFVFPSIYEGLGIAAIEAQAAGLPVLCSDHIPEVVGITDLVSFFSLNDEKKWQEEILGNLHREVTNRKEYGSHIKNSGYDIVEISRKLEDFYAKLQE